MCFHCMEASDSRETHTNENTKIYDIIIEQIDSVTTQHGSSTHLGIVVVGLLQQKEFSSDFCVSSSPGTKQILSVGELNLVVP